MGKLGDIHICAIKYKRQVGKQKILFSNDFFSLLFFLFGLQSKRGDFDLFDDDVNEISGRFFDLCQRLEVGACEVVGSVAVGSVGSRVDVINRVTEHFTQQTTERR